MSGPLIKNFSVPAGNDFIVHFDLGPDDEGISLVGSTIYWRAYEQEHGVPITDATVIEKVLDDGDLTITDPDLLKIDVRLRPDDTIDLLRNYYHEATVVDFDTGGTITVANGIMTVLGTENRNA